MILIFFTSRYQVMVCRSVRVNDALIEFFDLHDENFTRTRGKNHIYLYTQTQEKNINKQNIYRKPQKSQKQQ